MHQAKEYEESGYRAPHPEKEQEEARRHEELGKHQNDAEDQPSPPRQSDRFRHNAGEQSYHAGAMACTGVPPYWYFANVVA